MKTMAIFTGAGASKLFGYPLTSEIFPKIHNYLANDMLFDDWDEHGARCRRRFREYIQNLLPGYKDGSAKDISITQLLSFIDYSIQSDLTPFVGQYLTEMHDCRNLIQWAMTEALWPTEGEEENEDLLQKFVDWLGTRSTTHRISLISTNYDCAIENAMVKKLEHPYTTFARDVDYGFHWRFPAGGHTYRRPAKPKFEILKLHGSLNWVRCALCNHVYINLEDSPI